jgi:ABC-type uncharacterized transport system permease subunit
MSLFESILFATVAAGTPLLLVAMGELICEKSGMLNLGAEGMMSVQSWCRGHDVGGGGGCLCGGIHL